MPGYSFLVRSLGSWGLPPSPRLTQLEEQNQVQSRLRLELLQLQDELAENQEALEKAEFVSVDIFSSLSPSFVAYPVGFSFFPPFANTFRCS